VLLRHPWAATIPVSVSRSCTYERCGYSPSRVLAEVGKAPLNRKLALEYLDWLRHAGLRVGISLMFGGMATDGTLLESEETVDDTAVLAKAMVAAGIAVSGIYPNIRTVLPGAALEQAGQEFDFHRMPR